MVCTAAVCVGVICACVCAAELETVTADGMLTPVSVDVTIERSTFATPAAVRVDPLLFHCPFVCPLGRPFTETFIAPAGGVAAVARALPALRVWVPIAEAPLAEDGSVSSCSLAVRPAVLSPAGVSLPEPIQLFPEESSSDAAESIARKVLAGGLVSVEEVEAKLEVVAADGIRTAMLMHVARQQFTFEMP
jgi:hypothetical protein